MTIKLRRPRLVLACVALVAVAGVAMGFQDLVLAERTQTLNELRQAHHAYQQREQQVEVLNKQLQQVRARELSLHERIPQRLQTGNFLEYLGTHLAEHRAREIRIQRGDLQQEPPFQYTSVQVEFQSSFDTAWQIMQLIEDYGRGIRPTRARFDRGLERDAEVAVRIELIAVAHAAPAEEADE